MFNLAQTSTSGLGIEVRIAATVEEYTQAFKIAYEVYYPLGFTNYSAHGMRATPYQFEPDAVVFLANVENKDMATLTVYEGKGSSLPSAAGWPEELAILQAEGRSIFELGALMVRPNHEHSADPRIVLETFRSAWRYARQIRQASIFCGFVQEIHLSFYIKVLGFKQFGQPKDYSWKGLNNDRVVKVVPVLLDLDTAEETYKRKFSNKSTDLHRFFVLDKQDEIKEQITHDLNRLKELDRITLRHSFSHLLPVEARGADQKTNL